MSFFPMYDGSRILAKIRPWLILVTVLIGSLMANSATAGDTDRLANCVAAADMARAAAESREKGVFSDRTLAIIAKQKPAAVKSQTKSVDPEVYSDSEKLTPDQAAAKVLYRCFESDVL